LQGHEIGVKGWAFEAVERRS